MPHRSPLSACKMMKGAALNVCTSATIKYPQDAYVCFIKSLQCEWGYVQRVVEGAAEAMDPLDKVIQDTILPAVFGRGMLSWKKELVKAAVKRGWLGVRCPTGTAKDAYQMSVEGTAKMVEVCSEAGH